MPQIRSKRIQRSKARAKMPALRGRGSYLGDLWKEGKKLLPRAIGGAAGALVGKAKAGWDLGGEFSKKVLGWGDYTVPWTVSMNSLASQGQAPTIGNVSSTGVRLVHREYIGTVYSSTTFSNSVFYLNPGLSGTFPWLSKMAANFQQYELMGAVVTFKSALTDAVATFSSLGSVVIAADMNAAAAPATSQLQMEQMQFVASAKPSETVVAPIECAPRLGGAGVRYIRAGPVPTAASILDYDHCMIQVAAVGQPSAGVELGRLYISYDVKLLNPKMLTGAGSVASYSYTPVSSYAFGVSGPTRVYDSIGVVLENDGTGYKKITIPPGTGTEFSLDLMVSAGGDMTIAYPTTTLVNIVQSTRKFSVTTQPYNISPQEGLAGARNVTVSYYLKIVDPSLAASITVASMPFHGTGVAGAFEMTFLPAVGSASLTVGVNSTIGAPCLPSVVEDDEKDDGPVYLDPSPLGVTAAAAGAQPRGTLCLRRP